MIYIMTSLPLFQNKVILRRPRVAHFAYIIKISIILIKKTFKNSEEVYQVIYICWSSLANKIQLRHVPSLRDKHERFKVERRKGNLLTSPPSAALERRILNKIKGRSIWDQYFEEVAGNLSFLYVFCLICWESTNLHKALSSWTIVGLPVIWVVYMRWGISQESNISPE